MAKEKHSRADRAAIRYIGYHEWCCGNSIGVGYRDGYAAGFKAAMRRKRKRK